MEITRGDIFIADLNPVQGSEQGGVRPVLVIQNDRGNRFSPTVIAQGEDVAMNITGCDGMGTGGCGDVLTGVIAALLAQGMSTWDAARVGAFYHGRAGEAAQKRLGARAVTAWDVCEALRIE